MEVDVLLVIVVFDGAEAVDAPLPTARGIEKV